MGCRNLLPGPNSNHRLETTVYRPLGSNSPECATPDASTSVSRTRECKFVGAYFCSPGVSCEEGRGSDLGVVGAISCPVVWDLKMIANFFCTNFSHTPRGPGNPGLNPGVSRRRPCFPWLRLPPPPHPLNGLWTHKLKLGALFSCVSSAVKRCKQDPRDLHSAQLLQESYVSPA